MKTDWTMQSLNFKVNQKHSFLDRTRLRRYHYKNGMFNWQETSQDDDNIKERWRTRSLYLHWGRGTFEPQDGVAGFNLTPSPSIYVILAAFKILNYGSSTASAMCTSLTALTQGAAPTAIFAAILNSDRCFM